MDVVSLEAAQQMRDTGQFLVQQEVLGHIYGITGAAVRKLQAIGKLPLLDLDRVQDVEQLQTNGFQVTALRTAHAQLSCAGTAPALTRARTGQHVRNPLNHQRAPRTL
jgi:hypothetical protein